MTPAKIYPFSIPAGGSFPLLVIGDYCKILTSSGALTLTGDTFGTIGPILAGQGVENSTFQRLVLTDNTGAVNNGTILIADNKFIDDRITGSVEIIDGGKSRTNSNKAFIAGYGLAAVAGFLNVAQLINSAGSGKNIYIKSFSAQSASAQAIFVNNYSVPLATLIGGAKSKKFGSADSTVGIKYSGTVTLPTLGDNIFVANIPASQRVNIKLEEPIQLIEGQGIILITEFVNTILSCDFEFYEEAIL